MTDALPIELQKTAYRQTKDGFAVTFTIHPNEKHDHIRDAPVGARFAAALVQIGDDEQPVPQKPAPHPLVAKAGILCKEPNFQTFLSAEWPVYWREAVSNSPEKSAALVVCELCGIKSRAELATNPKAQEIFEQLIVKYDQWRREGK